MLLCFILVSRSKVFYFIFFPKNKKQGRLGVMHPNVSGTIKTALPGMDREVKEHYQVVIQAKDMAGQMGGLSGTTTVSITLSDVNDSPPRFANRKRLKIKIKNKNIDILSQEFRKFEANKILVVSQIPFA